MSGYVTVTIECDDGETKSINSLTHYSTDKKARLDCVLSCLLHDTDGEGIGKFYENLLNEESFHVQERIFEFLQKKLKKE